MLNTFFFGYLSLKYRRLFRIAILLDFILYVFLFKDYFKLLGNNFVLDLAFIFAYCVTIALISWLLKVMISKNKL